MAVCILHQAGINKLLVERFPSSSTNRLVTESWASFNHQVVKVMKDYATSDIYQSKEQLR